MPVLSIDTNIKIEKGLGQTLRELSQLCSNLLGKPEQYVMVQLNDEQNLIFAGSNEPAANCSLTSLDLTDEHTKDYSEAICSYLEDRLEIPANRIYIEFKSPQRSLFGWNKSTF